MKRVLVNIVSEQTVPNYLFVKEFENEADLFLFISSRAMETREKTKIIFKTAGISKNRVRKILVQEDEWYLAKAKLDKLGWTIGEYQFLVNISGGTKLMSNAVYEYFKQYNSRFFYLPIAKNEIRELFKDKPAQSRPVKYSISVKEYLCLHDIAYSEEEMLLDEKKTMMLYDIFAKNNFHHFPITLITGLNINGQQKEALWFEHYLFYKIKALLALGDLQIKTGIKLYKKGKEKNFSDNLTDNEIDIVFIKNNNCYIVEAKVSVGKKKINTGAITSYLYKLAAINKRFGINAKAVLMLFAELNTLSPISLRNMKRRCEVLNLPVPFDRHDLIDGAVFKNKMLTFVN